MWSYLGWIYNVENWLLILLSPVLAVYLSHINPGVTGKRKLSSSVLLYILLSVVTVSLIIGAYAVGFRDTIFLLSAVFSSLYLVIAWKKVKYRSSSSKDSAPGVVNLGKGSVVIVAILIFYISGSFLVAAKLLRGIFYYSSPILILILALGVIMLLTYGYFTWRYIKRNVPASASESADKESGSAPGPVRAWLQSFFSLGYGVMPLGDGRWVKQEVPDNYGDLVFSSSRLAPVGRLLVVPHSYAKEFFARMARLSTGKDIFKILISMMALAPLLANSNIIRLHRGTDLTLIFLLLAVIIGLAIPMFVFGVRLRRKINEEMLPIDPHDDYTWIIRLFNVFMLVFMFLYSFCKSLIDVFTSQNSKTEELAGASASEMTEDSVTTIFSHRHSMMAVSLWASLKAIVSIMLVAAISLGALYVTDLLSSMRIESLFMIMGAIFTIGFIWSYFYYLKTGVPRD